VTSKLVSVVAEGRLGKCANTGDVFTIPPYDPIEIGRDEIVNSDRLSALFGIFSTF
jgi:hypothetical protein